MSKLNQLLSSGIVAVIRKVEADKVPLLVETLVQSGVSGLEITVDSENAIELISELAKKYENNNVVIGAGTVLNKEQAQHAIEAGAHFIFAPTLDKETIEYTKSRNIIMIPGVYTPTEIYQAHKWGADVVKIFPARALGPQFIKDVAAPLGNIPMMPTGGVGAENIGEFIRAGAVAAGVGGSLVDKKAIENEDWNTISKEAQRLVEEVKKARI